MGKRVLISGITGQDGSYLAELLLANGCEVHGIIRRASTFNTSRIDHIYQDPHDPEARLFLHYGDLGSGEQLTTLVHRIEPDEIYHLGAQTHVKVSFEIPVYTGDVSALGTTRLLEAIRHERVDTKFYQASSSEMFGDAPAPQNEDAPFRPRSPYASAKVYAFWIARMYREGYGIFACNGILFNHESPRRGETFVTRKITRGLAKILAGNQGKIFLGNLNAARDWGYAPEYVVAMWKMLQQSQPDDYVLGTGESHSVQEFAEEAFTYVGLKWSDHVEVDSRYFRPLDVTNLRADASKAQKNLGWQPRVRFRELVRIMVDADVEAVGLKPPGEGKKILERNFDRWHHWDDAVQRPIHSLEGKAVE